MSISIAMIGECMLELTQASLKNKETSVPMNMMFGGDTINTAVYLARYNTPVSYITAVGDDVLSDWLLERWSQESIDCSLVTRMPNSVPAMYMVNVASDGERSFFYWRKNSPASRLFDTADTAELLFQSIADFPYLYLTGISLAILPVESRKRLLTLLKNYHKKGGKIIFDGNYRPSLWPSIDEAQQAYTELYSISDIALSTFEDEALLFGYETAQQALQTIHDQGVPEVVMKMGGEGCLALLHGDVTHIEAEQVDAVDTTAAGDSFNAAYLAARFEDQSLVDACRAGHSLASKVIQHPGAIIPIKDTIRS